MSYYFQDPYILTLITLTVAILIGVILWYSRMVKASNKVNEKIKFIVDGDSGQSESENDDISIEGRIYEFNNWINEQKSLPKPIVESWDRYYSEFTRGENSHIPDIYEFFTEEQLVQKYGFRKFVESIPAILVSAGILGTFFGITNGLSDISATGDSNEIQNGIDTLLDGMQFAFYSSIAGIILSLVFQTIDKFILYNLLSNSLQKTRYSLDYAFPIKSENNLLEEIVQIQQNQMNDLKTFLADEMVSKLTSGISEVMANSLNPHLEKSNEIMEKVANNTMEAQNDKLNEMVKYFVDSLNDITGDHMANLGDALSKTIEWQERVHIEMSQLVEELKEVAVNQAEMAKNTSELSEKMNDYTSTLSTYQERMVESTRELVGITDQNSQLMDRMRALFNELVDKRESFEESFSMQMNQLHQSVGDMQEQSIILRDLQKEMNSFIEYFNGASQSIEHLTETNIDLSESLTTQAEETNQFNANVKGLLVEITKNQQVNTVLQTNMEEIFFNVMEERQMIDAMKDEQIHKLETFINQFGNQIGEMRNFWNINSEQLRNNRQLFESVNETLDASMEKFVEHMHEGIESTFKQFDEQLKKSVEYLERGVHSISQVVESLETNIEKVSSNITGFNEVLEQIAVSKK